MKAGTIICSGLIALMSVFTTELQAQVTVGNSKQPETFSVLEVSTANRAGGLRLPQLTIAQRDVLATAAFKASTQSVGLMILNTDTHCVECWNGTRWISLCNCDPVVSTLTGSSTGFSTGNATSGTTYSGTMTIPYSGGNGATYPTTTINSTGVTGLTATLVAGTLASGAGNLTYNITGTPTAGDTAAFAITFGGQSCSASLPVISVTTLTCSSATFSAYAASGDTYSGTMTVPYTGGSGATYAAGTAISSTGVTGLTATLVAGTLANGAGSLTYNITGTPTSSGTASFALSFGGQSCSASLTVAAACPGYLAVGGTYTGNYGTYLTDLPGSSNFATTVTYFTATGGNLCFYKTDGNSGIQTDWATTNTNCNNGSYADGSATEGWRLPTLAELGNIQGIFSTLSSQTTSISGTTNMHSSSYYWSSTEYKSMFAWGWSFYWYAGAVYITNGRMVRCVRSN
jgi:hypothetical protein